MERHLATYAGLLAAALVLVAPLLTQPAPHAGLVALAVALAALVALRPTLLVTQPCTVTSRTSYDDGSALRGRVADPVHHPRRPRAPGAR
ncbi:hypothetical protein [Nocardioides aequoreus]|uniref:hypothetical protein n=1 Tax=Nocardioides aequoreus TaxID=397278 RepID=UPI0004C30148|nr:hypothetical protein [Nocardioides aequoreus]